MRGSTAERSRGRLRGRSEQPHPEDESEHPQPEASPRPVDHSRRTLQRTDEVSLCFARFAWTRPQVGNIAVSWPVGKPVRPDANGTEGFAAACGLPNAFVAKLRAREAGVSASAACYAVSGRAAVGQNALDRLEERDVVHQ